MMAGTHGMWPAGGGRPRGTREATPANPEAPEKPENSPKGFDGQNNGFPAFSGDFYID